MPLNPDHAATRALGVLLHSGSFTALSDGQLLERFATRDREAGELAFAALIARHGPLVWRTCRAVLRDDDDAGDAFQATFLVLVRKAGSLWVDDSIGPWLHRVAFRTAVHAKRARNQRRAAERRAAERTPSWIVPSDSNDLSLAIHREIERLPDRHRIPLVLCDLEGRSQEEAARLLKCPVGTVKSRLARGRARLRDRLLRRGLAPISAQAAILPGGGHGTFAPPPALSNSTIRSASMFADGSLFGPDGLSPLSAVLAEGVLKVMRLSRLKSTAALAAAVVGVSTLGWIAYAAQAAPQAPAPVRRNVEKIEAPRAAGLEGNWMVRGYPSGQALALFKIERRAASYLPTLLSVASPEFYRPERSTIEQFQVVENVVRFRLRLAATPKLAATRPADANIVHVVAYLPEGDTRPKSILGSMAFDGRGRFPAKLERTDLKQLDPKEPLAAGNDDLRKFNQTKDRGKQIEILEGILKNHGETPMAPVAAWALAITIAESKAPATEIRRAIDRAIQSSAPYGPEMKVGAINVIVRNLAGMAGIEELVLDYARRAEAMLRPSDPSPLQEETLRNLVNLLRRSDTTPETEIKTLEARLAKLGAPAGDPDRREKSIEGLWARNFAAARKNAAATGKLVMVDFFTQTCGWCKRLDADVYPKPAVVEAMRRFVPVKVDAEDGEGRPLVEQYQAHIQGYPAILFIDPTLESPQSGRIVGKIPGYMPATAFVERLKAIAVLPRDRSELRERLKTHADDGEAARRLATASAMQGELDEAAELAGRDRDAAAIPNAEEWAAVYSTIGDELLLRMKPSQAAEWYDKASRAAKRPVDVYLARVGAGLAAGFQGKTETAVKELEAAANATGIGDDDREFARTLLNDYLKAAAQARTSTPR